LVNRIDQATAGGGSDFIRGTGTTAAVAGGGNGLPIGTGTASARDGGGNGLPIGTGTAEAIAGGGRLFMRGTGTAALARAAEITRDAATTNLNVLRDRVLIFNSFRVGSTSHRKRTAEVEYPKWGIVASTKVL
jgi:hypothetical protein